MALTKVSGNMFLGGVAAATPETGSVTAITGGSIPTGYLECDGSAISRVSYSALFSLISTLYGVGDGSTTFNIPDLRGEFIRGWDNGRGIDIGRSLADVQLDEYKSHNHLHAGYGNYGAYLGGSIVLAQIGNSAGTSSSGGTETRPRNLSMMYIIRY